MEIDKTPQHILLVFEGLRTEHIIYKLLKKHGLSVGTEILTTFDAEIYQLYKKIIEEDADLFLLLKERDKTLVNISKDNISAIFLFFDFDSHATNATDAKVRELLNYFDNETDEGKLFISYPMVESFKYFKQCDVFIDFLDLYIDRSDVINFKKISHELSNQSKSWSRMDKQDCQNLIKLHCIKSNHLVNNKQELPKIFIPQNSIFKIYENSNNIYILSAFPLMLKYYFNHDKFLELVS